MKAALPCVSLKERQIIEALHFVFYVLNPDPSERPSVDEVLGHPFLKSEHRLEEGDGPGEDIPPPRVFQYASDILPTAKDLEELEEQSAQRQGACSNYDELSSPEVLWTVEDLILSEKDPTERSNASEHGASARNEHRGDGYETAKGDCQPKGSKFPLEDPASKQVVAIVSAASTDSAFFEVDEGGWTEMCEPPVIQPSDFECNECPVQDHSDPAQKQAKKSGKGIRGWLRKKFGKLFKKKPKT